MQKKLRILLVISIKNVPLHSQLRMVPQLSWIEQRPSKAWVLRSNRNGITTKNRKWLIKSFCGFLVLELENVRILSAQVVMGNKLEYLVYIAGKIYLRYLEKKLSIQRTRYTIITPAMTILIIRTNIIYRIKDLFLWNNNVQR